MICNRNAHGRIRYTLQTAEFSEFSFSCGVFENERATVTNFNHTVALRINAQRKPARIRESTLNKIDSISKESNRSRNKLINILLENSVDDVEI